MKIANLLHLIGKHAWKYYTFNGVGSTLIYIRECKICGRKQKGQRYYAGYHQVGFWEDV